MTVAKKTSDAHVVLPKWHVPPPMLAGVAFGAQIFLSKRRASTKMSRMAGFLVASGSLLLDGAAVMKFQQTHTTINPKTLDTTELVVTSPYSWTRNPMYLGITGVLVAHAMVRRSWTALLPVVGFVAYINRFQIPAEEAVLQQRFGAQYEKYRTKTPRWVGFR